VVRLNAALVLGGASCVWRDVAVLETLIDGFWPGLVIAVNDVACRWPRSLDHWATVHPEKLTSPNGWRNPRGGPHGWLAQRAALGRPGGFLLWSEWDKAKFLNVPHRRLRQWASGSSGLFAVSVAYKLGCTRVILAGVPMDPRPHFRESTLHDHRMGWTSYRAHIKAWRDNQTRLRERTRSLSGTTRAMLGAPTLDWLEAG
jgi:hypothetical protein